MPLDRYHILQNEIDPCAVKGNYLECTPLRQEKVAQNWFFMSYLGTAKHGTAVKAIQDFNSGFLEPMRQLFWVLEQLLVAAPGAVSGRTGKRVQPTQCELLGLLKPSPLIIPCP